MGCLKCGRDTSAGEVFCEECLEIMQYYPVKPGTAVMLPQRRSVPVRKTVKRRAPSPEEQIKVLRRRIWILSIFLFLSLVVSGLLAIPTYEHFMEEHFLPGQNYTAITSPSQPVADTSSAD